MSVGARRRSCSAPAEDVQKGDSVVGLAAVISACFTSGSFGFTSGAGERRRRMVLNVGETVGRRGLKAGTRAALLDL